MSVTQTCTYNGYSFAFLTIKQMSADMVYADDGATLLGQRYTITLSGVITATGADTTIANEMNRMRFYLMAPRRSGVIKWNPGSGDVFLFQFGQQTSVSVETISPRDMQWGPTPLSINFSNITGGLAAEYDYTFSTVVKEKWDGVGDATGQFSTRLLSILRAFNFAVDANGFTTRTVSGKLVIQSPGVAEGRGPSWYRDKVFPPLPDGFQREHQTFDVQTDGVTATFCIVDREVQNTLPKPVTRGDATVSSRTSFRNPRIEMSLSGWFEAAKDVPQSTLVLKAYDLVKSRLPTVGFVFIEHKEITSSIYGANRIQFAFRWWVSKINRATKAPTGPAILDKMLSPPPDSDGKSQPVSPYGTAGLWESKYIAYEGNQARDSDLAATLNRATVKSFSLTEQTTSPAKPPPSTLPDPQDDTSQAHRDTPFYEYNEQISWEIKNHIRVFVPKVLGAKIIMQQTGLPTVYVIQAGSMSFLGVSMANAPKLPEPPSGGRVLESYVAQWVPTPIGDGEANLYKTSWRYVTALDVTPNVTKDIDSLQVPADPRRASSKKEDFSTTLPAKLVVKPGSVR